MTGDDGKDGRKRHKPLRKKSHRTIREQLQQAVEALESHPDLATNPRLRKLAKEGRAELIRQVERDKAVERAEATYREARARADEVAKTFVKENGQRNVERIIAFLVANGQLEAADTMRAMLARAKAIFAEERRRKRQRRGGG